MRTQFGHDPLGAAPSSQRTFWRARSNSAENRRPFTFLRSLGTRIDLRLEHASTYVNMFQRDKCIWNFPKR